MMKLPECMKFEWCLPLIVKRELNYFDSVTIIKSVISLALEYKTIISFSRISIN
jgi:hypothetical protein